MGNTRSTFFERVGVDPWWNNDQTQSSSEAEAVQTKQNETRSKRDANEARLMEVKMEISSLHEKRKKLIAEKKKELEDLRQEVVRQKQENEELKEILKQTHPELIIQKWDASKVDVSQQTDTFEVPGPGPSESHDLRTQLEELKQELSNAEIIKQKNRDLQINFAELQKQLQSVNSELAAFENERKEYKTHVIALKDIIAVSKQLLLIRDGQIKELSQKVAEIQTSLSAKELAIFSDDLRGEYERQLRNIKQLKQLYEERQQADKTERDSLKNQLEEAKTSLKAEDARNKELQERIDELEEDNKEKSGTIMNLQSQLGISKAECGELRTEMNVINQLFSQTLLGFNNGQEIDMDKLIKTLEENHDLLTDIVINEECTEISSALPKVLLDLVSQVRDKATTAHPEEASSSKNSCEAAPTSPEEPDAQASSQQNSLSSASEIVQNLPKVWKVLTELLSHQVAPTSVLNENGEQSDSDKNPCYKSVQTPTGPTLVLSVSKTFIRLKNLIIEKKSLEKETTRLKQLNTHLETRLQDQEKRLGTVSHELSKTWHVVGKMQKQHQQLHTQEKILRYELAQKRKLLNELKEELEYCREKWLQAKEKNSTTEEQWKQLRTEFASRKNTISEDLNNSVESGYSDERESSDDDDVVEFESELSVASPEPVPECGSVSEIVDVTNEALPDTASVETVINMNLQEFSVNEDVSTNNESILQVIQDEISHIESSATSGCAEEEVQLQEAVVSEEHACESSILTEAEHPTDELKPVLNGDGSTEEVHSEETLKTDLVQIQREEVQKRSKTPEEMLAAREERLKRLEQQANDLVAQTTSTSQRSIDICTKLDDLHEQYGGDPKSRRKDIDDMYKKLEEDILQTIKKTQSGEDYPSTSRQSKSTEEKTEEVEQPDTTSKDVQVSTSTSTRTTEEMLAAREERLKRLEEQSNELVSKTTRTKRRSIEISTKLDELHQQYGENSKETQILDVDQNLISKTEQNQEAQAEEPNASITDAAEMLPVEEQSQYEPIASRRTLETPESTAEKNLENTKGEQNQEAQAEELNTSNTDSEEIFPVEEQSHYEPITSRRTSEEMPESSAEQNLENNKTEQNQVMQLEEPSTSSMSSEERLARREERLQRMEQEARELMGKAIRNSYRGFQFCSKLNKLHDRYGTSSDSSDEGADDNNNNAEVADGEENSREEQQETVPEENRSEEHQGNEPEKNDSAPSVQEDSQQEEQ